MIAIGAGLDAGDFLSQSAMFRLGKTAGQANGDVDQKNDRETSWRGYPNLFIFLAAGIITIVVGTIVQAIFSPPTN